ncbi:protease inhibitor I9 family protein [Arthrobacter roseus]|uniref:protease inhibitor I9 family protein n=1 Tax=Arthrobacter roseus TaxID=136274 RepID=UPI001963D2A2
MNEHMPLRPDRRTRTRSLRTLAAVAALSMTVASLAGAAQAAPGTILPDDVSGASAFAAGKYLITLKSPAVSTYDGGINGMAATAPANGKVLEASSVPVVSYSAFLEKKQSSVAAAVGVAPLYHYTMATNGFAAELTADQAARLAANENVAGLEPDAMLQLQRSTTDFLGLGDDANGKGGV